MKSTLPFLLGALARLAAVAQAHTIFTTLYVDDVSQGDGTCVRMSKTPDSCTSPVSSITSDDMACGANGQDAVAFTCPAPAGGKLTFQYRMWADAEKPGVLDKSHKGPCAVYAKQLDSGSSDSDSAAGPGWFKLWDEGYDEAAGLWCTEKLIAAGGLLSFRIPAALPAGSWLFRPELLALHNANAGDPQFYVGCAQVFVEGSASAAAAMPSDKSVSIPGHVAADDPGLTFDIYSRQPAFPYPMPGPAVFVPPSSSPSSSSSDQKSATAAIKQTQGKVPADALIKNANWAGFEVDAYTTQDGCWASADQCWDQAAACYDAAPPTGNANCRVWERRCDELNDACGAGDYEGPPNAGEKLASAEPAPAPAAEIPEAVNEGLGQDQAEDQGGSDGDVVSVKTVTPSPSPSPTPAPEEEGGPVVTVTRVVTVSPAAETSVERRRRQHRRQFR
ncbi:hypothetical protein SLS62_003957 [Diatrype stigma]|uniref:lytic cellulose monooxygenase (C4-dehydrogenating) n=1 Tax=Diatrype stigma TaxID=117547 RepID=A0AAN9UV95_9PEZI